MGTRLFIFGACAALLLITGCGNETPAPPPSPAAPTQRDPIEQRVEAVTDGVYVAIGYGLANSILLEGDDGVVVVDTMESRPRAEAVLAAFREVTEKPVKAVVLTHNHADHVFGGKVFTEGRDDIPVYAHASTPKYIDRIVSVVSDAIYRRSMRMFGQLLPDRFVPEAGIGVDLEFRTEDIALARPTQTFEDRLEVTVAGLRLELIHAPGETPDQIVVWLPDKRVLLPADNLYQAFPNLYTIRGTQYRHVMQWVRSLDRMRDLQPEYLVPSHTEPVSGAARVQEVLTAYRDAIQYVHDQTVRGLNAGKTPAELAASISLPPHLQNHPHLQQVYGDVAFSVKSIYNGYLGWFNGDAAALRPLPPQERSERLMEAFGSGDTLPDLARSALADKEYRWAAELARHWTRAAPDDGAARDTLARALEALGKQERNFPARYYFLTQALEWRNELDIVRNDPSQAPKDFIDDLPIDRFMTAMPVRLKAEDALDVEQVVQFRFTDVAKNWLVHIRRGVAEVRPKTHPQPDIEITTTADTWKGLVTRKRNPAAAYATGEVSLAGGPMAIVQFLSLFERP